MKTTASKVTIHMVSSLDGFIAKKDGSLDWMQSTDHYEQGVSLTQEDIADYLKGIDCYVMGSHTYEKALEHGWPYADKPVIVLTHRALKSDRSNVEFYQGDLGQLINDNLKPIYKNIWMVGGAKLTKALLQKNLADEIIITIMPVILGDGVLFFDFIGQEIGLHLTDVTTYKDGMVELTYDLKNIDKITTGAKVNDN